MHISKREKPAGKGCTLSDCSSRTPRKRQTCAHSIEIGGCQGREEGRAGPRTTEDIGAGKPLLGRPRRRPRLSTPTGCTPPPPAEPQAHCALGGTAPYGRRFLLRKKRPRRRNKADDGAGRNCPGEPLSLPLHVPANLQPPLKSKKCLKATPIIAPARPTNLQLEKPPHCRETPR